MRSIEEVRLAQLLVHLGLNDCQVARATGIPRETINGWRLGGWARTPWSSRAQPYDRATLPRLPYSYLLGLYLGDGYLARHARGVYRLGIYLDQRYPWILEECAAAMSMVIGRRANFNQQPGCVQVNTYSKQWPRLFPQHGPGPKHLRPIVLEEWQRQIVEEYPREFLRGLIHSDGWRGMNRVTVKGKQYAYPRYQFSNASDDIRQLFCDACDLVGVEWRRMNARNISVAKRDSVALMDTFIGLKA
jgi:hypothetical protein